MAAAVYCSPITAKLGGVKMVLGLMSKLGRAWVGAWVGAWVLTPLNLAVTGLHYTAPQHNKFWFQGAIAQIPVQEKNYPVSFFSCDLMIAVNLQISSFLCTVIDS